MVPKRHYIKEIEEIITNKLQQLDLGKTAEVRGFIERNKRFYSAPCIKEKEKFFFKILIVDEVAPIKAIQREIETRKFLEEFKEDINFPLLIKSDGQNLPYWFLSQYLEGKLLGHFYELYLNDKKHIPKLINVLLKLHGIPKDKLKKFSQKKESHFWKRDFSGYLEMVKSYQEGIRKEISKDIDFERIYQLFEKERAYLENSSLVLAHGDFTLANFVISQEKLIVNDWEQAHLDNFVYDFSHLWIQLWRYPDWQRELISEFLLQLPKEKKEEFKKIFKLIIISEALGELRWSIEICEEKYRAGAIEAAKKTVEAALKGFDYLIKST